MGMCLQRFEKRPNSALFGLYFQHSSLFIVLPAIPHKLVYIWLRFLSQLSPVAWGHTTKVSGVGGGGHMMSKLQTV